MSTLRQVFTVAGTKIKNALTWVTADRTTPPPSPAGNWIPNSNGEGGKVISSGHSGTH